MAFTIPPIPTFTDPTLGADPTVHSEAWHMLNAKYADTWAMGNWAAGVMNAGLVELSNTLGSVTVEEDIAALSTEIGAILAFVPGTISGGTGTFTDDLLTSLKSRLAADIATYSTGLGAAAETAMFGRVIARHDAVRAQAYNELTLRYSSYRRPPGALLAKQAELSNQDSLQLSEANGQVLEQTTRSALDYNKHILSVSVQLVDALARVFDSQEARTFEASKSTAMLAVEAYKSDLGLVSTKADIVLKKGDLSLASKARQVELECTTLLSLSQGFQQVIASAMNGVNAGVSFGFGGSASTTYVGT